VGRRAAWAAIITISLICLSAGTGEQIKSYFVGLNNLINIKLSIRTMARRGASAALATAAADWCRGRLVNPTNTIYEPSLVMFFFQRKDVIYASVDIQAADCFSFDRTQLIRTNTRQTNCVSNSRRPLRTGDGLQAGGTGIDPLAVQRRRACSRRRRGSVRPSAPAGNTPPRRPIVRPGGISSRLQANQRPRWSPRRLCWTPVVRDGSCLHFQLELGEIKAKESRPPGPSVLSGPDALANRCGLPAACSPPVVRPPIPFTCKSGRPLACDDMIKRFQDQWTDVGLVEIDGHL
jgi:hypothetical protein